MLVQFPNAALKTEIEWLNDKSYPEIGFDTEWFHDMLERQILFITDIGHIRYENS